MTSSTAFIFAECNPNDEAAQRTPAEKNRASADSPKCLLLTVTKEDGYRPGIGPKSSAFLW